MGDVIKLIGKGLKTGMFYEPILNDDQLSKLEVMPEKEPLMVVLLTFGWASKLYG